MSDGAKNTDRLSCTRRYFRLYIFCRADGDQAADIALSYLLETIMEKLNNLLTISKLEGDAAKVETYCSVCGPELCYTE